MQSYERGGMTFYYKEPKQKESKIRKEPQDPVAAAKARARNALNKKYLEEFIASSPGLTLELQQARLYKSVAKFKREIQPEFQQWKFEKGYTKRPPSELQRTLSIARAKSDPDEWRRKGYGETYSNYYNNNPEAKKIAQKRCRLAPVCQGQTWRELSKNWV